MRLLKTIKIIAAVAVAVMSSSCADREAGRIMDTADAMMWTMPDSALTVMESIDTLTLNTKAQRARYSLLYTMALNRNCIDTSDLRVILPAADYYERHGSPDKKMKAYYYYGVVQHNAGNLEEAVGDYIKAKEWSCNSDDMVFRGLVSSAIADAYSQNNNYNEGIVYAEDAMSCFMDAGDSARIWITTGMLASMYGSLQNYEKSDSLFSVFFSSPCRDSSLYARQLLNEALSFLWRPSPEPEKSSDLFLKAVYGFNAEPTPEDYCAYAYAMELQGDNKSADDIISQLEILGSSSDVLDVWKYRICRHRGDFKKALNLLESSVRERDNEVFATVKQSVALAQSEYYQTKSDFLVQEKYIRTQRQWLLILSGAIMILGVLSLYFHKKIKWEHRMEEMMRINDNVNYLYSQERLANLDLQHRLEVLEGNKSVLMGADAAVRSIRSKYIKAYKSQIDKLNSLCAEYWTAPGTAWSKDKIYEKVKEIVSNLENGNESQLETIINEGLDGIMTKLREDMPQMMEKDSRFIAFQILGFDAKTISQTTGYSVATIYTKRNRLKKRLEGLESENRDFYLEVLY